MLDQHLDIGEPGHARAQYLVDRGLIQELLGWMATAARLDFHLDEGHAVGVDKRDWPVRQHVGLQALGQADGLPDAHHLFVGGDGPGPPIDVRITFYDYHFHAKLTQ
ncbi:hypothetical protein MPSD_43510 [Mycobacterium pseudoshottsii JCM 15466]|nr:hypothetical protein [Mycobacterium pseudoshottsii]RFZ72160.1 hypothetical protein DL240490_00253 [Mycobacterium marinum]BBA89708.1 hypothetical protein MPSD_43510 [Mycobacterium pseudoshottsii JCM 15466]